jgi:hypothetical protein
MLAIDPALAASILAGLFFAAFVIVAMTTGLLAGRWRARHLPDPHSQRRPSRVKVGNLVDRFN